MVNDKLQAGCATLLDTSGRRRQGSVVLGAELIPVGEEMELVRSAKGIVHSRHEAVCRFNYGNLLRDSSLLAKDEGLCARESKRSCAILVKALEARKYR